jgi:hypothetical protein
VGREAFRVRLSHQRQEEEKGASPSMPDDTEPSFPVGKEAFLSP